MSDEPFFISPGGDAGDAHDTIYVGGKDTPSQAIGADEVMAMIHALCDMDWCIGYELGPESNHVLLDKARDIALQIMDPENFPRRAK